MKPVILAIALAGVLLAAAPPPARADESGRVVRQVRRVSPTETTIIYRDTRPSAARRPAARPAERAPEFREYDLQPAAPAPRASVSAQAMLAPPSYSETWSPGPTMAAGAGGFSGGGTFAVSPAWGGNWWWGDRFGPRPGWHGGGTWHGPWNQAWGLNTHTFPWYSVNPFAATPYLSPFPGPPMPTWGTVPGPTIRCP